MGLEQSILVGARGWDHDDWSGGFYPDDLPSGWRLTYYANWLRAVLVPGETWNGADVEVVRQWAADCDEAFRFVLELPRELSAPQRTATIQHLLLDFFKTLEPIRMRTAALLLRVADRTRPNGEWLDPMLHALGERVPVCVDLPPAWRSPDNLATLARHHASLCWHAAAEPAPQAGGRLLVAIAREAQPRAQRVVLERLAAWSGPAAALFFDTPRKAAEQARQARQLAEIMQI
jgi:uncharacterized protein YecE (DUF72 family)